MGAYPPQYYGDGQEPEGHTQELSNASARQLDDFVNRLFDDA